VGASRPRVTEHLARLERDGLVIRQGRQLVVRSDQLEDSMSARIPDLPATVRNLSASDMRVASTKPSEMRKHSSGKRSGAGAN
jgi:DNA-binding FadR family transcriptional regulator